MPQKKNDRTPFPRQHPGCIEANRLYADLQFKKQQLEQQIIDVRSRSVQDSRNVVLTRAKALLGEDVRVPELKNEEALKLELRAVTEALRLQGIKRDDLRQDVSRKVNGEHGDEYAELVKRTWKAARDLIDCQEAESRFIRRLEEGGVLIGTGSTWNRVTPHYSVGELHRFRDRIYSSVKGIVLDGFPDARPTAGL